MPSRGDAGGFAGRPDSARGGATCCCRTPATSLLLSDLGPPPRGPPAGRWQHPHPAPPAPSAVSSSLALGRSHPDTRGGLAAISLAQRGRGAETHTWPWSRDPQMWSHVAQGSVHPETRISRVERCTYCPAQSQGTVMAKRTASWGCSARGEAPPGTDGDQGCPPGTLAVPSPQASYDRGRPTTAPRRVCGEAPRGHQHTGQWWGPALGLCEALWGHSGMDQAA